MLQNSPTFRASWFTFCLLMILVGAGCSAGTTLTATPASTKIVSPSITATALLPTLSATDFQPTPTTLPTPTALPSSCPKLVSKLPPRNDNGYLILATSDEKFIERYYRLSITDNALEPFLPDLPRGYITQAITSNNGQWLAFIHEEDMGGQIIAKRLIVVSAVDSQLYEQTLDKANWHIRLSHWQSDNQHIIVYPDFDQTSLPGLRPDKVYQVDPFVNEWETITQAFKYSSTELWDYWGSLGGSIAYDSTLMRVVILDSSASWVLYDVKESRELWRAVLFADHPAWAKYGSVFAFTVSVAASTEASTPNTTPNHVGFGIVDRNGKVTDTGHVVDVESSIPFYGMSPDGRYIWFQVLDGPMKPGLYFWDLAAGELISCFADSSDDPIWSPSGKQFAISLARSENEPSIIRIVDFETQSYVDLIQSQAGVITWLSAPN